MGKLINCQTCGQQIAAEAKICPHCGAKNKKRQGGCLAVFIVLVFFSFVVIPWMSNRDAKAPEGYKTVGKEDWSQNIHMSSGSSSASTVPESEFSEIKNDPTVEKVELTGNKIKVIYKKDLPEMCYLEMRKLAQRGTNHTKRPYSAECSVAADPDKILYFETRDGNQTTVIAFTRNKNALNRKLEEERLAEARRQQRIVREQVKKSIACDKFERQFVSKWDGSCRPVVETVKKNMKDPKSFEHIKTKVFTTDTDNFLIEMRFRGNNSFGALVVNTVTATVTPQGQVIAIQ